jgi:hypothetical protein
MTTGQDQEKQTQREKELEYQIRLGGEGMGMEGWKVYLMAIKNDHEVRDGVAQQESARMWDKYSPAEDDAGACVVGAASLDAGASDDGTGVGSVVAAASEEGTS